MPETDTSIRRGKCRSGTWLLRFPFRLPSTMDEFLNPDSATDLLPPKRRRGGASQEFGRKTGGNGTDLLHDSGPAGFDNPLLPPRRRVRWGDAQMVRTSPGDYSVSFSGLPSRFAGIEVLPGGNRDRAVVDSGTVRIQEGGRVVELDARKPSESLRYRIAVNLVSIVLGLGVLLLVFWLAINGYL